MGEFQNDRVQVFPKFNITIHGLDGSGCTPALREELKRNRYMPPEEWTHYLALDPGHTQPAVAFASVPPSRFGDHVVIWGEVYTPYSGAKETAREVKRKVGTLQFEDFIIDMQAGRQTGMGMVGGATVETLYREAFRDEGLISRNHGPAFVPGTKDIAMRNMIVNEWLECRANGTTKLILVEDATPNMQKEFKSYKKRVTRSDVTDVPIGRKDHLMGCLGYIASHNPSYNAEKGDEVRRARHDSLLRLLGLKKDDRASFAFGPGAPV